MAQFRYPMDLLAGGIRVTAHRPCVVARVSGVITGTPICPVSTHWPRRSSRVGAAARATTLVGRRPVNQPEFLLRGSPLHDGACGPPERALVRRYAA